MPILSWLFSEPLLAGEEAPDFSLPDQAGNTIKLSDYRGTKNVVLVFYPGDNTSICTKQLCEFRDGWRRLASKNTLVFGVNPQSAEKHTRFIEKYRLPFPLLVDKGQRVANLYNASGLLIRRTVYLIGKSGRVRFSARGKPTLAEVLSTAE
jgi:peroxiredoxin Q/BCP